jgi:hypothetical protein
MDMVWNTEVCAQSNVCLSGGGVCPDYAEWVSRIVQQISPPGAVAAVADCGLNS